MRARKTYSPTTPAIDVEAILRLLEGRWKLVILFHLFGGKVQRFSDVEKLVTGISQKMLAQQLRQLEDDGIVARTVHHQMPPKVDYRLTEWGQCSAPRSTRCSYGRSAATVSHHLPPVFAPRAGPLDVSVGGGADADLRTSAYGGADPPSR